MVVNLNWKLRKGENNVLHCDREDGAKSFILTNQCTYDANISWFERLYSHKYQEYDMFKNYIREELLHEDKVELIKDWFTQLTPKDFVGYYIPVPIKDTYFSLETQEFVELQLHNIDDGEYSPDYGEIVVLDKYPTDGKYFVNYEMDLWGFWYDRNTHDHKRHVYDKVQDYFTNDKFKEALNYLYKTLLAGKTYVGTTNSYMFIQRFTHISNYSFD